MPPRVTVIVHGPDVRGSFAECLAGVLRQLPPPGHGENGARGERGEPAGHGGHTGHGEPAGHGGHTGHGRDAGRAADAEVVVVPTDAEAREATARAVARDGRLLVVEVPEGTSEAEARVAGARRAGGEWLQFVAGGDRLPAGSLRALTGAIQLCSVPAGRHRAEVILLNHTRSTWSTEGIPSPDGPLLDKAGHSPLPLVTFPGLLRLAPLLGTRLVRASFWRTHQEVLTAGNALYTAYALLLLADRVACSDQIALDARTQRAVTLPPPAASGPEGRVEPYVAAYRLLEPSPATEPLRRTLYDLMTEDWLHVIAREQRGENRAFFFAAAEAARACKPEGHRAPEGVDGVRQKLLEAGSYERYVRLAEFNDRRRHWRALARKQKSALGRKVRAHRGRAARKAPLDPELAVFTAYWNRGVTCNPGAIAAKLAEIAPHIKPVWVSGRARVPLLPPGTDHVVPGTPRYQEAMGRATYLVNNVNFPTSWEKRPGQVHLQTHHGTPLKRMGLDQMPYPAAAHGLDFRQLLRRVDKWDYSLTSNRHSTLMWRHAYPSGYTELEHGYPRNDVYYTAGPELVRAVRTRLGIAPGTRAVLYAPTHRDYESEWHPRLDLALLAERLGPETVLLVRGHYFYSSAPSELAGLRATRRVLDVSAYEPVEELALAADALVTDYSSLMFDYAHLDRPIVIYADDWQVYQATRGVYFDLLERPPGAVARTEDELAEILAGDAWRDPAARAARTAFRERFCAFDDGRAAERVVRRVFLGTPDAELPPVLPLSERTPAPTPEEAVSA
ncbi:CDP-glycerol glycerophosphotransferase family protein [Streptomyces sp. CH6]|uniref:CDP-glycerol glycerophosphotransferase family protein n=1 Tax=Streptomyces sp. CH6 TaxID=3420320 RepID=UPI003D02250B